MNELSVYEKQHFWGKNKTKQKETEHDKLLQLLIKVFLCLNQFRVFLSSKTIRLSLTHRIALLREQIFKMF